VNLRERRPATWVQDQWIVEEIPFDVAAWGDRDVTPLDPVAGWTSFGHRL
jgi:hypothetical protein